MPAKKAKTPPRSVRYLLSADRKLRRLSLKKMAVRMKREKKPRRAVRAKRPARAKGVPARSRLMAASRAVVIAFVGVAAAVTVIAARQSSHEAVVASLNAAPESALLPDTVIPAQAAGPESAVRMTLPIPAAPIQTSQASPATVVMKESPPRESAGRVESASPSKAPSAASPVAAARTTVAAPISADATPTDDRTQAPTAITGCLELDDDTFRLKDTSGDGAPTSRSWKSAFLKKRPAPIEVVDATSDLKLQKHVGERVVATGLLTKRTMQARSLQLLGACS